MKIRSLLIKNRSDLKYAVKTQNDWDSFIASHQELEFLALEKGLSICGTETLVPPIEYSMYIEKVAHSLEKLDELLGENYHPNLKSVVLGQLARQLFLYELYENRMRYFGQKIYFRDHGNKLLPLNKPIQSKSFFSPWNFHSKIPHSQYIINFQSPSGQKTDIFPNLNNSYKIKYVKLNDFANHCLRTEKNVIYITVPAVKKLHSSLSLETFKKQFDNNFSEYLFNKISYENFVFFSHYNALKRVFSKKDLPFAVYFNFVKDSKMAASMAYFSDRGVEINMQSHGALHVHGDVNEMKISKVLANSIYNNSPGVSKLFLRSKLQLNGIKNNILPNIKKVVPSGDFRFSKKFRILIAPNFTNWSETPWGLHSTCHDILGILQHLADLMQKTPEIEWALRLKFSLRDIPSGKDLEKLQGLSVNSIRRIFSGINNFTDVSQSSYNACIQNSDLIITEGITTVPYDAWENRRPVVFIRYSNYTQGLLRRSDESNSQYTRRAAYHSQSCEDFKVNHVYALRELYWNKPLINNELEHVLRIH